MSPLPGVSIHSIKGCKRLSPKACAWIRWISPEQLRSNGRSRGHQNKERMSLRHIHWFLEFWSSPKKTVLLWSLKRSGCFLVNYDFHSHDLFRICLRNRTNLDGVKICCDNGRGLDVWPMACKLWPPKCDKSMVCEWWNVMTIYICISLPIYISYISIIGSFCFYKHMMNHFWSGFTLMYRKWTFCTPLWSPIQFELLLYLVVYPTY